MYNTYAPQVPFGRGDYYRQPIMSNIIRVSGVNGVNALQIAPNQQVIANDDSEDIVYIITTDSAGYKTFEAYDCTPHVDKTVKQNEALEERIKRMEAIINELYAKQSGNEAGAEPSNA